MDNFYDCAKRMYKTSETLHIFDEYHNSCYTAGYVIECYAKIIVKLFSANRNPRRFGHDVARLSTELKAVLSGNTALTDYIVDGHVIFPTVLSTWNPEIRYIDHAHCISSQSISEHVQNEIKIAMARIAKLIVDGYNVN